MSKRNWKHPKWHSYSPMTTRSTENVVFVERVEFILETRRGQPRKVFPALGFRREEKSKHFDEPNPKSLIATFDCSRTFVQNKVLEQKTKSDFDYFRKTNHPCPPSNTEGCELSSSVHTGRWTVHTALSAR